MQEKIQNHLADEKTADETYKSYGVDHGDIL